MLENLCKNAWKFTKNNPKAKIEFGMMETKEGKTFFIKDNGIGFDMKYAEKLFRPFQRLHTNKEFPGIGIGLATLKSIIQKHNGKIWAESQIGKGTTFYYTINTEM